jgi:hypothetical protein
MDASNVQRAKYAVATASFVNVEAQVRKDDRRVGLLN